jgi:hypothetical protein
MRRSSATSSDGDDGGQIAPRPRRKGIIRSGGVFAPQVTWPARKPRGGVGSKPRPRRYDIGGSGGRAA